MRLKNENRSWEKRNLDRKPFLEENERKFHKYYKDDKNDLNPDESFNYEKVEKLWQNEMILSSCDYEMWKRKKNERKKKSPNILFQIDVNDDKAKQWTLCF